MMRNVAMFLAIFALSAVVVSGAESTANPIRRVVSLLQNMAKKVAEEGEAEEKLHEKYMCWCSTSGSDLKASIEENKAKAEQLEAAIAGAGAALEKLKEELAAHKEGRAAAKDALAKAKALRAKEAAAFASESADLKTNLDALSKAIPAIESGMTGFLQTSAANLIRRVSISDADLSDVDRDTLTAFLAGGAGNGERYVPQSGEIVGILKQMSDEMTKDLKEITEQENAAKANSEEMQAALVKEIAAHTKAIEEKTERIGNSAVENVNMKHDLELAQKSIVEDTKFLADLEKNCKTKEAEWTERTATRSEELLAIHETIKILNDDDALELFKKTLPTPSLLQVDRRADEVRRQALDLVRGARASGSAPRRANVDLIALALTAKKADFSAVIKMIDDLVALLAKEQADDDSKLAYCKEELDKVEDTIKELNLAIGDLEKSIADKDETLKTLASEIEELEDGIKALDKAVAEATEQRKAENAEYKELMSSNTAAKELIGFAKNRMQKFYNPTLYKPPPKRELSEEERMYVSMGGELAPTAAPGGIAGTGISALVQAHDEDAPPPPPETFGAYAKKTEESGGVMAMMDLLVKELDKEMQEATVDEKNAQEEYEGMMADSAKKRADDSASITEKEAATADTKTMKEADEEAKASTTKELLAKGEYEQELHAECDWLMQNHALRKEARASEVDSLTKAKAVLAGADFS